MRSSPSSDPSWNDLARWAQSEVRATLRALPPKLRAAARALPVTYDHRPGEDLVADGIEPDTLGLFVGGEYAEGAHALLPAQIILFLDNLWDMVEGDVDGFREEIRTTLLHELGHYLGLDEDDLEDRGLE
ncbi:MAG: metallopeptidase family protein [Verrucomicrobia bacterium]|nr:metallopeptidase family protein [Verrucomicrobiota bacterium]